MKRILALAAVLPLLVFTACAKKVDVTDGKAHVEFKWQLHINHVHHGWLEAEGWVVNRGTVRADWVQVTIYYLDKKSGVVLDEITEYISEGAGPNGKSLDPGQVVRFTIRLNTKNKHKYKFDRDVTWSQSSI